MLALLELQNSFVNEIHRKDITLKEDSPSRIELAIIASQKRYDYIKTHVGYKFYIAIETIFMNKYSEEFKKVGWFYEKMHFDIITNIKDIVKYLNQLTLLALYYKTLSDENHMDAELKLFICFYYAFIHNAIVEKVAYNEVSIFCNNYYNINENVQQFAPDIEKNQIWLAD